MSVASVCVCVCVPCWVSVCSISELGVEHDGVDWGWDGVGLGWGWDGM